MEITVAICTFNRSESLARTLSSLERQVNVEDLDWELLLIDNNSGDNTAEMAERFAERLPLRYVFEGVQGLSSARNRALKEYCGNLLIFTDDDVVLDVNWLSAYRCAKEKFAAAGYFGGRILPHWENNKPAWLRDPSLSLISGLLVFYDIGEADRSYHQSDPAPFGASFALRREVTSQLDPFRLDLGVKGACVGRGEESEYLERVRAAGFGGVYVGSAVCYHQQDGSRFRLGYLYQYGIEKGRESRLTNPEQAPGTRLNEVSYAVKGLWQLIKGRGDRFRQCVINMGIQRGLTLQCQQEKAGNR